MKAIESKDGELLRGAITFNVVGFVRYEDDRLAAATQAFGQRFIGGVQAFAGVDHEDAGGAFFQRLHGLPADHLAQLALIVGDSAGVDHQIARAPDAPDATAAPDAPGSDDGDDKE